MKQIQRRLTVLEQVTAERKLRDRSLAPGDWYRWASTGTLPEGEAAIAQVAVWQRRRQEAEAILAEFEGMEPDMEPA